MLFERRDLIRLLIPLIIEQALSMTVGMFDTIMVASAGETAVSGVALVEAINNLLLNLFAALATGGAIVAGQYLGRRDRENASRAAKHLVLATFLFSTTIMVVCLLFNRQLLSLIFGDVELAVMGSARSYFYITAPSYPFMALFNASAALFRGMGNSKVSMVNALIMNVVNVTGNAVFIYGFGWGAFGAGLATLIARIAGATSMMLMLRSPALNVSVRSYSPRDLDGGMIKRILRIGIPNGLENSMFQIGRLMTTSLVAFYGTVAIAANAVGSSLAIVGYIPAQAAGFAMTTVVARCVGAGEYEQASYYIKRLLQLAYVGTLLLNVVMQLAMNPLLGIFQLSAETAALARQILRIHGMGAVLIWPAAFPLSNAFRAAGDVKFTMVVAVLSMWTARVGFAYLLAYTTSLGMLSVWFGMMLDWLVRAVCFLWRWVSGRWKKAAVV